MNNQKEKNIYKCVRVSEELQSNNNNKSLQAIQISYKKVSFLMKHYTTPEKNRVSLHHIESE